MPIINLSEPFSIFVGLILFLLILFLSKNTKKAWIMGVLLCAFVIILVFHSIEFSTIAQTSESLYQAITSSAIMDLIFILLSFLSYLWIDHIESEKGKKKVINDGLDWFWNKV